MADRISIAEVRLWAEEDMGEYREEQHKVAVLALVEAVEAAQKFLSWGPDYGGQSSEDFVAYMDGFDSAIAQLREKLTRFEWESPA